MRRVGLLSAVAFVLVMAAAAMAATSGWKVQHSPSPSGAMGSQLSGVSCASQRACTAVGQYNNGSGYLTLAERWNGKNWSLRTTPSPSTKSNGLEAVWCASANNCMAVGSFQDGSTAKTLAERWNGKKWSIVHTPNPTSSPQSGLDGVMCTSTKACVAVGFFQNGSIIQTLAERWNGKKWAIETTPNPAGATLSGLSGVSCTSRGACTAVGFSEGSSTPAVTLAERWNGKKWSIEHPRNPTSATSSELTSIFCAAARSCMTVGYYDTASNHNRTLAERWNGKKWSIQRTLNPTSDPNHFLYDISCTSADACTAVGETAGEIVWDATLVEHWNGSKWSVQNSPHPGTDSELQGVSCSSTSRCTAVGWHQTASGPQKTLVEHR